MKRDAKFNVTTYLYFICWGSRNHTHSLYVCVCIYIHIYDVLFVESNHIFWLLVKHNIKLHESHLHVNEIEKQNRIILIIFCWLSAYLITFFLFYFFFLFFSY